MKTDYQTVKVTLQDGVAILTLDNPPVNQMSPQLMQDFGTAMGEALQDGAVKAIIMTGTGKNFIAGADITQIQPIRDKNFLLPRVMENNRFILICKFRSILVQKYNAIINYCKKTIVCLS